RKADAHKLASTGHDAPHQFAGHNHRSDGHSPKLIEDLTAQRSAAIGAELMGQPDIALAAIVHALVLDVFYLGHAVDSCLKLDVSSAGLSRLIADSDTCKGLIAIEQERERFGDRLPGNADDLWQWLLDRSRDEKLDLLAFIAATSIDAVQRKAEHPGSSRLVHANLLTQALGLDMGEWFKPTAENYFGRVNRAQILVAIDEANGSHAPALEKLKRSELASRAEQLIAGTSWLPQLLRVAVNDNDCTNHTQAAE
ncbi:MAG: hypothetical protein IT540_01160, partial [Hyphomicrobium sp.]|nr:hypothetical protein [Hyphomicrobium sp.]